MILNELSLARLCERVYREAYDSYDEYDEFDEAIPIIDGDAEAIALIKGKTIVFVFRGTEIDEASDLITVLKSLFTTKHTMGQVHRGFAQYHNKLITGVLTICSFHKPEKIVVAGHSLGGAIATLMVGSLRRVTDDVTLFTIGSPRVGKAMFADNMIRELGEKCYQFVIKTDVVTYLPPKIWPFNYKHLTKGYELEVSVNAVQRGVFSLTLGILGRAIGFPSVIDKPYRALVRKLGLSFVSDHTTESYLEGMAAWLEQRKLNGREPMIQIEI